MASARKFFPRYSRDDLTLCPVLEEISSHPISSLSSLTSAAGAEMPGIFQLLQRNIDPERTIINLNQVSTKRGLYQDSYPCGCLPNCCPACRPGPALQRVHCPCHGAALPLRTFLLSNSDWYGEGRIWSPGRVSGPVQNFQITVGKKNSGPVQNFLITVGEKNSGPVQNRKITMWGK